MTNSCVIHQSTAIARPVRSPHALPALALALLALAGCDEGTRPELERPIVEVAREAGVSRISTDPEIFVPLLEQVSARRRIIVLVKSAHVPPVRIADALAEPAWQDMILMLPHASDTSSVDRGTSSATRIWSDADVQAVSSALKTWGAGDVQDLHDTGIVIADLPNSRSAMISILEQLGGLTRVDTIEPAQSGAWNP